MDLLLGAILGAILGVIATEIFNYFKRRFLRKRKEQKARGELSKILFEQNGYLALDHAIPYYKKENITLRDTGKQLFIEIPEKYRIELKKHKFETRKTIYYEENQNFVQLFNVLNFENIDNIILKSANEVAMEFIAELGDGFIRFNGLMYGVKKVRPERLTIDENSGLDVDFYETDFFTYRVFGRIYHTLKENGFDFKINKLQDINNYGPFLSSWGLSSFIIINKGYGDEIIIGKRSDAVVVDRGKWHFSMNEAFSIKDRDEYGNPSLSACLFRGIEEELGISEIFKKHVKQFEFLDLDMDIDRFEIGITSFIRIDLDEVFTFKILLDLYSIAQDGKLETSSIFSLPIREIDDFIKTNCDEISITCREAMKALNARYKAGYLREDS